MLKKEKTNGEKQCGCCYVWNYDSAWKIFWYENGVKMGEMQQYTGWDPAIVDYTEKNRQNFRYKYIGAGATEHLFYAEPVDKNADIKIEVIDRFGNIYQGKPQKTDDDNVWKNM